MKTLTGFLYYPDSLAEASGTTYFLVRSEEDNARYLGVMESHRRGPGAVTANPLAPHHTSGFLSGQGIARDSGAQTHLFPLTPENAEELRRRLPWLRPQALGLRTTAGFGDRLGLATPGHVRAVEGSGIAPIFAQQSVRENARTHRTPQQVLDDATWGVFQCGWRDPWGADADHLKTTADIDSFFEAGFTFFTLDPGEHVDPSADTAALEDLRERVRALPWSALQTTWDETTRRYLGQTLSLPGLALTLDEPALLRAYAKYGRAIVHTVRLAAHLAGRAAGTPYDLEISVDETETPTSPAEHFLIAGELHRLGVHWTSLAPRFVGRFEKGVDYIGDLGLFEEDFARHAAIARHYGFYRLSLHSGSDKFSIYRIAAQQAGGLVHLKTAGTSYLEALRVIAEVEPGLFREILQLAIDRYEIDRASYHVSARLQALAGSQRLDNEALAGLLEQFDARQVFHVTFGAVLDRFGPALLDTLRAHEHIYDAALTRHFKKHLAPLSQHA